MCKQLYQIVWLEMKGGKHESGLDMSRFYRVVANPFIINSQTEIKLLYTCNRPNRSKRNADI